MQSPLPIGDSERFDDIERPVGGGRLSVDVLDVRGYESGRDAVDCEFDVSGAVPQFQSRPTADGRDGRVCVGARDDLDLFERHPGVLNVAEPSQHRASLEQLHHQACPELLGVWKLPELPVLGLEREPPPHQCGVFVPDRPTGRKDVHQRLVAVHMTTAQQSPQRSELEESRERGLAAARRTYDHREAIVEAFFSRVRLQEGHERFGGDHSEESLVVPEILRRSLFEGIRHAVPRYPCRWRRRKSGRIAGAEAPSRTPPSVSAHSRATELFGVLCSSTRGSAQPP